ncbi:hypothetical protein V8G54_016145 [Vigna mungo]|uniref:Uncharacterized protein n=1 Tax=Vigna mungo TaxID=3915 RepID=A0AAQ3NKL8_VIGMU
MVWRSRGDCARTLVVLIRSAKERLHFSFPLLLRRTVREDDEDVSQVTFDDDEEGERLRFRLMVGIWVSVLKLGFPIRYLILGCSLVARLVAREALMVVAMGVKVARIDSSVLADLEC